MTALSDKVFAMLRRDGLDTYSTGNTMPELVSEEALLALIEDWKRLRTERDTIAIDLDYARSEKRACDATGAEWRSVFKNVIAIESDVGTPEEMEFHMRRMIDRIRDLEAANRVLSKLAPWAAVKP